MKTKVFNILTAGLLFLLPNAVSAQAPTLGTTADFVLFSSIGAVTNVGTQYLTLLTGHVGANSGPISNFGNVDGNLYAGGPESAACAADLTIAYNQLNATVATIFPGVLLGNGQTLTPGVHSSPGATTLNLELILDGLGDPNAVFIFKILGPFSTNAHSKVKLVNGTKACNVYWQVEGLMDMATGTKMRGTVIVNNAGINMTAGDTLEGRALTTNGAVTVESIFAYKPIGCGSPVLVGPLAPNLASAECFAVFSSIGPVTNNINPTLLRGDVGSNSGLTTGYDPLLVTGMIHGVPDGATGSCATDLNTAYNYLNALPTDIILMEPSLFGHNLVLTPHTYLLGAATALTDTLYLDAQGNADAVFVIKINGAFSTSVNSRVVLRNGAQAKNIYWKIDGATDITSNSIFNGSVISAGAISLLSNAIINGRTLTINGAVNTEAVTVNIPLGSCGFDSPLIVTDPSNQIVCLGNSASFSVSATGTNITYQWRKGNVDLINGANISGVTTATLTINPAALIDAASNYNVIVTGDFAPSDTSINVSLTVNTGPIITSEPTNQLVCLGSPATFTVAVTGSGINYQWKRGLTNLINGGSITGANTATLTINPVSLLDTASNYHVVISGGCPPNDTSIFVSLNVGGPIITSEPTPQAVCEGGLATFSVSATGTSLAYQWRKGTVNLINGGNISGANTATLTINPAGIADAATNYNVIVSGACAPNDTSINAALIIGGSVIITEPTDKVACVGSSVSFSIAATGSSLTYQWRKGTVNLVNGGNISGATSATLTINPVSLTDVASNYNVVVSGACAPNDTSVMVSLSVTSLAVAIAGSNSPACVDGLINLTAQPVSDASYNWTGPNAFLSTAQNPVIANTTMANAGTYSLNVTNSCETASTTTDVSVINCDTIDFFIPEGFSPNGDGINDVFFIRGIQIYTNNSFTIFNRWGDKVYETTNYQNTWTGTATTGLRIGGNELPVGTYFYILDLNNDTPVYKGTIYLNR